MVDAAPILLGIIHDHAGGSFGGTMERCIRLAFDDLAHAGRLDRPVEIVHEVGEGLPRGSAHAVERAFAALDERGVLAILGPAVSDNGLIVRNLADAARVPCLNYTGSEDTRSHYMFHYQIGSLEDEPYVLADHLVARGHRSVALFHDASPIGARYASYFDDACTVHGIRQVQRTVVPPLVEDLRDQVSGVSRSGADAVVYLGLGLAAHALGVALTAIGQPIPVVANSALMFGYANPEWTADWDGWRYCDTVSDDNAELRRLCDRLGVATSAGPGVPGNYDMGRLLAEGITRSPLLTRDGVVEGLERVKMLRAASGRDGTLMGFGRFERSALKGDYLVLREWRAGESVEVTIGR